MGLIYLVRKKMFPYKGGMKSLYYAVQRKLQKRGGRERSRTISVSAQQLLGRRNSGNIDRTS